jgi:hypothetical protein
MGSAAQGTRVRAGTARRPAPRAILALRLSGGVLWIPLAVSQAGALSAGPGRHTARFVQIRACMS